MLAAHRYAVTNEQDPWGENEWSGREDLLALSLPKGTSDPRVPNQILYLLKPMDFCCS
jgi:hypothetical protein